MQTPLSMNNPDFTEEDIKLVEQIRQNAPPKKIRKKHLVLGFKFDFRWALEKSVPLYGYVDPADYRRAELHDNISKYSYHCMRESGIARHLNMRVTDVVKPDGEMEYETIIGIAENTRTRRKLPHPSGIRKLMKVLETEEAPKWYVVSKDSY